jgi:hypothetical protein
LEKSFYGELTNDIRKEEGDDHVCEFGAAQCYVI